MSKRDDILDATLRLIIVGGFQSLTIANVLKEAQAGYGTLYNHFKSKDELIFVLYTELRKKISRVVLKGYDKEAGVESQFRTFTENYLDYCINNIDEMNFIEQFSYFYAESAVIVGLDDDGFYSTLYSLINEGKATELIKNVKTEVLIQTVNGSIMALARGVMSEKFELDEKDRQDFYWVCWDSIKA